MKRIPYDDLKTVKYSDLQHNYVKKIDKSNFILHNKIVFIQETYIIKWMNWTYLF